ncbi:SRPBCC domain-containing protein [Paucibacter sp. R3-3]|uniref:SRPBCC domain-containing protein n=1 Tax=Roseateles agri TaxID=3098619 RepID=A0ABU5DEP5_9BURK|nr:SRPBCC domain-containing protein [Paucibacter sp. R3-3]MDY0744756.1 SRPBCC domain-containing protein [Paucibacter sp. R3-3]
MKKTLSFSIVIAAPRPRVWDTMLAPDSYRQWTEPFAPGCYYKGSWQHGETIRFLAPGGDGMVARIAENKLHETISIQHLGMVTNGIDDTTSNAVKAWAPVYENYRFLDHAGGTELQVDCDTLPHYDDFMQKTWPLALERLKALCEAG